MHVSMDLIDTEEGDLILRKITSQGYIFIDFGFRLLGELSEKKRTEQLKLKLSKGTVGNVENRNFQKVQWQYRITLVLHNDSCLSGF